MISSHSDITGFVLLKNVYIDLWEEYVILEMVTLNNHKATAYVMTN